MKKLKLEKIKTFAQNFKIAFAKTNGDIPVKPIFYWKRLIFIFIFGLIIVASLNLYILLYFNKNDLSGIESGVKSDELGIKKENVHKLAKELDRRREELEKLMLSKPFIENP